MIADDEDWEEEGEERRRQKWEEDIYRPGVESFLSGPATTEGAQGIYSRMRSTKTGSDQEAAQRREQLRQNDTTGMALWRQKANYRHKGSSR
jgi:hypothetical protein